MTRQKFFLIICIFFELPSLWQKREYFVPQFSLILLPLSWRHNDTHIYACRKLQNWRTHKSQFCFAMLLRKHTTHFVKDFNFTKIFFVNYRFCVKHANMVWAKNVNCSFVCLQKNCAKILPTNKSLKIAIYYTEKLLCKVSES